MGVFLLSACEPLDQGGHLQPGLKKHTDRMFLSSAWEPLDHRCFSFECLI